MFQQSQRAGREYTNIKYAAGMAGGGEVQAALSRGAFVTPATPTQLNARVPPLMVKHPGRPRYFLMTVFYEICSMSQEKGSVRFFLSSPSLYCTLYLSDNLLRFMVMFLVDPQNPRYTRI